MDGLLSGLSSSYAPFWSLFLLLYSASSVSLESKIDVMTEVKEHRLTLFNFN